MDGFLKQIFSPNILVPTLLFILLSPGVFLTVPPGPSGNIFMSGEASMTNVLVHAAIFALVYYLLRKYFASYY